MAENRVHLVVATPCYGGMVTSLYATSLMRLQNACLQRGGIDLTVHMTSGDALIPRARQGLVAQFLHMELATHLIFIDADISFHPMEVFRLLDFNGDIAAGIYPTKKVDWEKAAAQAKEGKENLESSSLGYVMGLEDPGKVGTKNGFGKALYAGTGFMMIKRQVFLSMIEKYPELKYTKEDQAEDPLRGSPCRYAFFNCLVDQATGTFLSEDYSFCKRWRDMGGEIWIDLQSKLTHTGSINFKGDVSTQFKNFST
jgi:hypothetical protein